MSRVERVQAAIANGVPQNIAETCGGDPRELVKKFVTMLPKKKPVDVEHPKYNRPYGSVTGAILRYAAKRKSFTVDDLLSLVPGMPRNQIIATLSKLVRAGRCVVVTKGKPGHGGKSAFYEWKH
jgi:hypothetical protein